MNIFLLLKLLGGLTFFLFGMQVMSASLEKMAGGKLEHMLKKMTANPVVSMVLGAVITIAMQSSSATTVMLVGLVNSGIMQFGQTISVIFGANIGTTLTSWILSLSGIESTNVAIQMLKPENFSPVIAFIGILMIMICKSDRKKSIGNVFVGFAILMYGMEFMSDAVSPLAELPQFSEILVKFNNPLFGVLIGLVVTAIIQSSAASIGILQALSLTGGITFGMAFPIVMGQNIGTCATSLISSIGTNANAKRVAVMHIMIKIFGTVICLGLYAAVYFGISAEFFEIRATPVNIAAGHTVFNIITTVVLMPFSKFLVKIPQKLVRDRKHRFTKFEKSLYIDERILNSPSIAITECDTLTKEMCSLACKNINLATDMFENFDDKKADEINLHEEQLDLYEDKLGTYLVKLSAHEVSTEDSKIISKMLHTIGDFERLGDHALNLLKTAKELRDKEIAFSDEARAELRVLNDAVAEILSIMSISYKNGDLDAASKVEPLEQVIDGLASDIKNNHISRLQKGECTIEMGFILSDLLNNYERISDHCSNIAVAVIETRHNSFDTHKYLNDVKYGNGIFNEFYDQFKVKYSL